MRYSMLVYLNDMCKTLGDAVQYLQTAPVSETREEVLASGSQMIEQVHKIILQYRQDLKSPLVLDQLEELASKWGQAEFYDRLPVLLADISKTLCQDMDYKVRAVFFAELGGKWDSMESVYTFMRKDSRFDPVVVLTPIFRQVKQSDGKTKQEVIYQDYLTARGIPFLGYDQYDLDKDCPELAFICQPYESVTLQQFWPEHIAKRTRLVYLSYFLPFRKDVSALCQMPVYNWAWKVIGSSESHYQFYKTHSLHHGANMLLTGLPKMDSLVTLKERGVDLPKGWEKLNGKTVFLWNTWYDISMSSVKYFDDIFVWLDAHSDCALIWRPHPMMDVVTKLYYPDKYPKFQEFMRRVSSAHNAVLDKESSYEAAFFYSTAQISDYSSLMAQYLPMDKPLLWIKEAANGMSTEELVGTQWMEQTTNSVGVTAFMERIRNQEDTRAEFRKLVFSQDLPLADGNAGSRICESLWAALHQEDGMLEQMMG